MWERRRCWSSISVTLNCAGEMQTILGFERSQEWSVRNFRHCQVAHVLYANLRTPSCPEEKDAVKSHEGLGVSTQGIFQHHCELWVSVGRVWALSLDQVRKLWWQIEKDQFKQTLYAAWVLPKIEWHLPRQKGSCWCFELPSFPDQWHQIYWCSSDLRGQCPSFNDKLRVWNPIPSWVVWLTSLAFSHISRFHTLFQSSFSEPAKSIKWIFPI